MKRFMIPVILVALALPSVTAARWIKDKVSMPLSVEFSHYTHLEAVGKNCPSCHNGIYNILPEKNPDFTMEQMEKGKACGACHNGSKAFSVKGDCVTCHQVSDVAIANPSAPALFSHEVHTGMFGCGECHPDLYAPDASKNPAVTMDQMGDGESCGACHDGDTAFGVSDDCSSCHPTREIAIANPVAPASFSHEAHTGMFGCGECHPDLFVPDVSKNPAVTMDQMGDGESCGACHDGDTAFGVADDCSSCHPTPELKIESDAGPVAFSHEVHTGMFGCGECHPDLFAPDQSKNPLATMEQMAEGESCGACHDGDTAFSVGEDCETCHEM
ncbi:MAG: cytochrome C [Desulfuromonas sp.]|nr:MAG: cytochrome C [Desulfuromonas sp.]